MLIRPIDARVTQPIHLVGLVLRPAAENNKVFGKHPLKGAVVEIAILELDPQSN